MYQSQSKSKIGSSLLIIGMYFLLFAFVNAQETASAGAGATSTNQISTQAQTGQASTTEASASSTDTSQTTLASTTEAMTVNKVELSTERQTTLQDSRQKRIINLSANISNRMEAAIARLSNIANRLEVRIEKMNEMGFNTDGAAIKLTEAKNSISNATATLSNIDTLVFAATTSARPVSEWIKLREVYLEAGTQIRIVQQQLREVISLLKQSAKIEVSTEAATEATTSPENI